MLFMQIIAGITLCFALSCILSIVIMKLVHYSCCKQISPLSKYYYLNVPRKPKSLRNINKLDAIVDKSFHIFFLFSLFILVFLSFVLVLTASFIEKAEQLVNITGTIQTQIHFSFPIVFAIVALFGSFKKPYYILFECRDVLKRYKIYPCTLCAAISWTVTILIKILLDTLTLSAADNVMFLCMLLLVQVICFLSCLILLITCCHILLSDKSSELKLLDTLYFQFSYDEVYLTFIRPDEVQRLDILNDYLLQRVKIQTKRFEKNLKKCMSLSSVSFWNATDYAPFPSKGYFRFRVCQFFIFFISFILPFILVFAILVWILCENYYNFLKESSLIIVLVFDIFLLIITILISKNDPSLSELWRASTCGQWGYRFLDKASQPQFYIPRAPFSISTKGTDWLIALFNLLTLFRIELKNECYQDLYNRLLNELKIEQPDTEEYFALALAYMLCCTLLVEKYPDRRNDIDDALPERLSQNELLISWADAIWIDMKRDPDWYETDKSFHEHKEHVPPTKSIAEAKKQN